MTFRISARSEEGGAVVRIEGRLDAAAMPDLLDTCRVVDSSLRVDLSGLRSADAVGAEALRRLAAAGAELTDMSPHIRHLVLRSATTNRTERDSTTEEEGNS